MCCSHLKMGRTDQGSISCHPLYTLFQKEMRWLNMHTIIIPQTYLCSLVVSHAPQLLREACHLRCPHTSCCQWIPKSGLVQSSHQMSTEARRHQGARGSCLPPPHCMAEVAVLLWCTQSHNTDHLLSKRNSSLLVLLEMDIGRGRCMERWRLKKKMRIISRA